MGVKITHGCIKPKRKNTFGKVKKPFTGKAKNRKGSKKQSAKVEVNRIKPKYSAKNDSSISDEDQAYLDWLNQNRSNYGCFVCGKTDCNEWHHVKKYSNDRKNHRRLIPLCGDKHHRTGQELSAHGTPKKWRDTFSMEQQNEVADKIYEDYEKDILWN